MVKRKENPTHIKRDNLSRFKKSIIDGMKYHNIEPLLITINSSSIRRSSCWMIMSILSSYMSGIVPHILNERKVDEIRDEISDIHNALSTAVSNEVLLNIWMWIGGEVEDWIDELVSMEEFEAAQNLKNILGIDS